MSFVKTRHGDMYYTSVGEGVPLILIHGNTYTAATQERLAKRFTDEHEVFSVDLLAHGHSARPEGLFTTRYFAMQGEALADLLEELFPDKAVPVFGMSAGGVTVLNAICEQPARFAALILDGVFRQVSQATVDAHQHTTQTMSSTWDTFMRKQHGADWWPELNAKVEQTIEQLGAEEAVVTPCLDAITVPTLIFQGGADSFVPDAQAEAVRNGIAGATMIHNAEAGHLQAWNDSATFREQVRTFLHEAGIVA